MNSTTLPPKKVLLADDELVCLGLLSRLVEKWGYEVETVEDGAAALESLQSQPDLRLAILDDQMPGLTGREVCQAIRKTRGYQDLHVILVTALDGESAMETAVEAGANDYMPKPFRPEELRTRILAGARQVWVQTSSGNHRIDHPIPASKHQASAPEERVTEPPSVPAIEPTASLFQQTIDKGYIGPQFDTQTMEYNHGIAWEMLEVLEAEGKLNRVLLDRMIVCPRCAGLPTIRLGCSSCGSGLLKQEELIHHFACAYLGPVSEFEQDDRLVCPKCRAKNLVVGSDFEFTPGPQVCESCNWSGSEPEMICHCLRCKFRYPLEQSANFDLFGYNVN